jgi:hypothetical protein
MYRNPSEKSPDEQILDRIDNYDQLNATTLEEGKQKFDEQFTSEDVENQLRSLGGAFLVIHDHLRNTKGTFFDEKHGFPQQQEHDKDLDSFNKMTVKEVLDRYRQWTLEEDEDGYNFLEGEKDMMLYALGPGLDFFRAYYGIKDNDPWEKAEDLISTKESYKKTNYPTETDIKETLYNLQHGHQ